MISRRGPSSRVNAGASSAATFSFDPVVPVRVIALTVAARGSRRRSESSEWIVSEDPHVRLFGLTAEIVSFLQMPDLLLLLNTVRTLLPLRHDRLSVLDEEERVAHLTLPYHSLSISVDAGQERVRDTASLFGLQGRQEGYGRQELLVHRPTPVSCLQDDGTECSVPHLLPLQSARVAREGKRGVLVNGCKNPTAKAQSEKSDFPM